MNKQTISLTIAGKDNLESGVQKAVIFDDALELIFSQNGQIKVPVGLTFWGAYYGQCIDEFGISWKITLKSG